MIAPHDRVVAKKGDELYEEEFGGEIGVVTRTERQYGGIVAYVRFSNLREASFFADGLRRVRTTK